VHYYRRRTLPHNLLTREPYIVSSRHNIKLLNDLLADDYPVLLEGLHCCWLLPILRKTQPSRLIMVRAHNVEHHYYKQLAHSERRPLHRLYLLNDARKLRRYEHVLTKASHILAISSADAEYFCEQGYAPVSILPAGHGKERVTAASGQGKFILFQGDLSVADNQRSVEYLLDQVFTPSDNMPQLPFVIAGKKPPRSLLQHVLLHNKQLAGYCAAQHNVEGSGAVLQYCQPVNVVANPDDDEMQRLLAQAHICILFTGQATGVKLKLLRALYAGRFCLVNSLMVSGTDLAPLCTVVDTPQDMREAIHALQHTPFTEQERRSREDILFTNYSDQTGAKIVLQLMQRSL
jgi:hypothetical protein